MRLPPLPLALALGFFLGLVGCASGPVATPKASDRLVVLTFDDSVASHATYVAPLLKQHGFGATFYITEGFEFLQDKEHYLTWEQIRGLHADGFEIGNHTRAHKSVAAQKPAEIAADLEHIEKRCAEHGLPRPTTFSYPGYAVSPTAIEVLRQRGYRFARAGGARVFDPAKDDPLALPQAFDGKPDSTLEQFKAAIAQARDGKVAVLTFHGVPDIRHPWVNTDPGKFAAYMEALQASGCKVIAMRDLATYLPPAGK
jgi:peptidoglycan/xylan/chitin deacetylase (PgdA/CDA1 family)